MLHISVLAHFVVKQRSRDWIQHWLVPLGGIAVVLAVSSGMSALATRIGLVWLTVGLVYGVALKRLRRDQLNLAI